ncbi:DUF1007 family protein [Vibrio artabrorum]
MSFMSYSAWAHPHSWIDMKTQVLGNNHTVTGFNMQWTFDRMTTAYLFDGEDMSPSHQKQTLNKIAISVLEKMIKSHYFTNVTDNGKNISFQPIDTGKLTTDKGKATLYFIIMLKKPYQFNNNKLKIQVFDPTYYVDITWNSQHEFELTKNLKSHCNVQLIKPHPTLAQINRAMTLPIDENPDYQLGQIFTQTVNLTCQS